jgi:hypothetical protein
MGLLRRSSQIGFVIAGIAAIVFVVETISLPAPGPRAPANYEFEPPRPPREVSGPQGLPRPDLLPYAPNVEAPAPPPDASLTLIISGVTCLVSTVGAFSTMLLAWRLDRRQSRETELRIAQLQIEIERSRQISQVKVDQS